MAAQGFDDDVAPFDDFIKDDRSTLPSGFHDQYRKTLCAFDICEQWQTQPFSQVSYRAVTFRRDQNTVAT